MDLEKLKELRNKTNLSMTECKKALQETGEDVEKAVEYLLRKGLKKVEEVSLASEGLVLAHVGSDFAHILQVNCQTDFASRSDLFQNLLKNSVQSSEWLIKKMPEVELCAKQLGEQLSIKREKVTTIKSVSKWFAYSHFNGKIAVLLEIKAEQDSELINQFGNDTAMQIAAANPKVISKNDLSEIDIKKMTEIFRAQLLEDPKPKPEAALEKIIAGKLNKWYSEVCLLTQDSLLHPKQTISALKEEVERQSGISLEIQDFMRWELGEV